MFLRQLFIYLIAFSSHFALISSATANDQITLRLLATSDVHGHFSGYDYFSQTSQAVGLAHLAPVIAQQRATADISLLIENGDLIQGSPFTDMMVASYQEQRRTPLPELLALMGYDAANLGNHEFNYGLEYLHYAYWNQQPEASQIPLLSANLHAQSEYAQRLLRHQAYHLIPRDLVLNGQARSITIGLVGVLPPQIMQWDAQHLQHHITVSPMVNAAQIAVAEAKQAGADIIVLVAHAGMPKNTGNGVDSEQGVWQLAQIEDVDAIIFGHQHELFPGTMAYQQLAHVDSNQGTVFGKPAVQPGTQGSHLGVIDLTLRWQAQRWHVQQHRSRVIAAAAQADTNVLAYLAPAHAATQNHMQQSIGHSAHDLSLAMARLQPTHALQLIHEAQMWAIERYFAKVDAALQNMPRVSAVAPFHAATHANDDYTFIPAGVVNLGDIGNLYRYPNTLDVVQVNGAMLKQWLEQSAAALKPAADQWGLINPAIPSYQFDTFMGFDYQINVNKPIGERVTADVSFSEDHHYLVITNNYRANGGGNFAGLDGSQIVYRAPDQIQHILIAYLAQLNEQGYRSELQQNWTIIQD